jgi:hypothetical protein
MRHMKAVNIYYFKFDYKKDTILFIKMNGIVLVIPTTPVLLAP